jgi:type II secretory pathway pseudopilin PulG
MSDVRERGFTVVEVTLFLAITGMLFLIALAGTGNTIRSVRFSDSGRSLNAYVQQQYDDIINGLNNRTGAEACAGGIVSPGSQPVGTSSCLLLGKLVVFQVNSPIAHVYNVVGTEPANVDYSRTDTQLISDFQPKAVTTVGVATYEIPWDAFISGIKRLSDNQATNGLLLIRSPKSSRIVSYTYKPTAIPAVDLSPVVNAAVNAGQTTNFCLKNADGSGLPAKIVVTNAPTQEAVQVTFDADSGGNECNGI